MALAVESGRVGRFPPFTPPTEGPWDLPAMQTLEDTAAQWAYAAADHALTDQWAWVQQYWGGATLPPMPPPRWQWSPWALALLLVLGPRLVTGGVPTATVMSWVEAQPAATIPRRGPDGTAWGKTRRQHLERTVADVHARLQAWAQDVTDTVTTVITGAKRAGLTLTKLREGLAHHFTDWGQDLQRLVQTELSAARTDAILETATEAWALVRTHPNACASCHAAFDGKTFRILKQAPDHPAKHAETALWPGKWTLNWDKKPAEQWPAVPQHPRCRCRVVPQKTKPQGDA
ncbi:hypothetical protein [Sulfobacillus harzensis]|uniref:Uncharacterized protein n=1 Tax=Sulfobacillus harzensis TaxID=2729629 RepID=A0A7Y0L2N3_9FIRM|nr:hypothetical protein [Sulfobacillus harzensis]NMP20754.1 hypothetical protein [Sulfobacillus harzensis]